MEFVALVLVMVTFVKVDGLLTRVAALEAKMPLPPAPTEPKK